MSTQKLYHLNNQEDLKCLQSHDKEPLSSEQIADVEGPPDNDPLIITELLKVKDVVRQNNLEIIDDREMLSGGSFGPLFKLKARDLTSNQEIFIVERTFTERKDIERRFCSIEVDTSWRKDSEPRYEIRNNQDNHKDRLIIDYLYNEAQALKELQKIKGIPKFYGAVYDDLNGSILEEYIDGSDLSMLFSRKDVSEVSIIEILEKVKKFILKLRKPALFIMIPVGAQ